MAFVEHFGNKKHSIFWGGREKNYQNPKNYYHENVQKEAIIILLDAWRLTNYIYETILE